MGTLSVSGQTQGGIPGVLVLSHPLWNLEEDPPNPFSITHQAQSTLGPCHVRLNSATGAPGRYRGQCPQGGPAAVSGLCVQL